MGATLFASKFYYPPLNPLSFIGGHISMPKKSNPWSSPMYIFTSSMFLLLMLHLQNIGKINHQVVLVQGQQLMLGGEQWN